MTLVQLQQRSADATPTAVIDVMDTAGPHVWAAMTVEVALSVMASARAGHLFLCDEDGQCTGLITRAQLTVVRDSPSYTDQVRLGDIVGDVPGVLELSR
ncbi:CBS domain-containing protein [Streptomyces avermitilis]|uniref:CBS domain-containing protein n=1 Tax=Streptomyces avermitilis TaxID=33903 RepID=UPI0033CAEF38